MNWTAEQWGTLIVAACGALGTLAVSIIRALRGEKQHAELKAMLAPMVAPGSVAPEVSITQVYKYLTVMMQVAGSFDQIKNLPAHVPQSLPDVKTRFMGRRGTFSSAWEFDE